MRIECAPGSHTITFEYRNNNSTISSKSLVVTVISGRETTISGKIEKGEITNGASSAPTSDVQVIEVKKEAEVKVETSVAPATTSTPGTKTTVTFPAGSFNDDSSNAVLNLSVKSAGSEFSVTSSGTSVPVAGIDISLKVDDQEVTSFNGNEVVIETYIAKNLTSVSVKYNGTDGGQPTDVVYDPNTGKLQFKTNHFSEYYVLADEVEAYNTKLNKVYAKLKDAINDVSESNSTIVLLKDISQTETIKIPNDKNLILDLNGHTVTVNGTAILNNGTLEIKNGTVVSKTNVAICVGNASKTTIESGNYIGQEGAVITGYATGATININGGTFTAIDNAVIAGNGNKTNSNKEVRIEPNTINIVGGTFNGGIVSSGYIACGIYAPWKDTINVSGGTFNITGGAGIVARAGNVNVTGGTFNCTGTDTGWVGDNKNKVPCSVLVFDSAANYPAMTDDSKITVTGGTFTSEADNITVVPSSDVKRIVVSGGSFTDIDSAINYASSGATIKLADDLVIPSTLNVNKSITIDGDNHTITSDANPVIKIQGSVNVDFENLNIYFPSYTGKDGIQAIGNIESLSFENVNITNAFKGIHFIDCRGTSISIKNCNLTSIYPFNVNGGDIGSFMVENSSLNGWTSFSNSTQTTYQFKNCIFGEGLGYATVKPYGDTNFVGCTFSADYFESLEGGIATGTTTPITIKFNNCYMVTSDGKTNELTIDLLKTAFNYDITSGSSTGSSTINDQYWYVNGEKIEFNTK